MSAQDEEVLFGRHPVLELLRAESRRVDEVAIVAQGRSPALLDLLAGCKGFISSFCNNDAQKFLDQGGTTLDQATQTTAYTAAAKVFATDPFGIYISADNALYGLSSKVSGWKAHGITVVLGTNTTVNKSSRSSPRSCSSPSSTSPCPCSC